MPFLSSSSNSRSEILVDSNIENLNAATRARAQANAVYIDESSHSLASQVAQILETFDGEASLKHLFWGMLSYDRARDPLPLSILPHSTLAFTTGLEVFATTEAFTIVITTVSYFPDNGGLEQAIWAVKRNIPNCVVLLNHATRWFLIYPDETLKPRVRMLPLPGPRERRAEVIQALLALSAADESSGEELTALELSEALDKSFPGATPAIGDLLTDFERIARHPDDGIRELWPIIHYAGQFPLLTPEQERGEDLRGDEVAPDGSRLSYQEWRLVVHNLRLVVWMTRRIPKIGMDLADLVQEGCVGLMIAARRFDPNRGNRFTTYAFHWIKQAMYRALHNQCNTIRWPVYRAVDLVPAALEGRDSGLKPGEKPVLPLPWPVSRRAYNLAVHERDPITSVVMLEAEHAISSCFDQLKPQERHVLERRFGIGGNDEETLEVIGHGLEVTRQRIQQIEVKGMGKLHGFLSFDLYPHYHALNWRQFCAIDEASAQPQAPFRDFCSGFYDSD